MLATSLHTTVAALNQKAYAQVNDSSVLTAAERAFVRRYQPDQSLVIYGTLAPGRPNHHIVAAIRGHWQPGTIRGQLADQGWGAALGYFGLLPNPDGPLSPIAVQILRSDELARHWARLDDFEGAGYQRMLIAYEGEDRQPGVGHIYALRPANSPMR